MSTMDEGAMVIIKKCKSAINHKLLSVIIKKNNILILEKALWSIITGINTLSPRQSRG